MAMKKILCALLALAVMLGCLVCALAEDDLQAQLDEANAKIEELQKQVDTYYPYYAAQIAATIGGDEIIWMDEVNEQFAVMEQQYSAYGISLTDSGMAGSLKQDIATNLVSNAVQKAKAEELGLTEMTEEEISEMETAAETAISNYIDYYLHNVYPDDKEYTDEQRQEAQNYLTDNGITYESYYDGQLETVILDKIYNYVVADVAIDEDDVQQTYDSMVAADQENYADDYAYNSARTAGTAIAYNPEGYRAVKHVLIKFDDDQTTQYSDLQTQLDSLNTERETIEAVAAGEQEPEEGVALRTVEEVDADIAACAAEKEQLYTQLLPKAQEVVDAFNAGTAFEELIEQYNEDPGMMSGFAAENGYAVREGSEYWDPAFTEGAMSIAEIGGISAPVYGDNGIHIIYYMKDVASGAVDLEEIRSVVEESALENKMQTTFDDQLNAWMEEANVEYYTDNFA